MTQREQDIALIRSKCIEANPEINEPCTCPKGGRWDNERICEKCGGWEYVSRPIRLADVLLAISESEKVQSFGTTMMAAHGGFYKEGKLLAEWNLRKDSLTDQPGETINFIHTVLMG